MTTQIEESIGRPAILALANNYPNMPDALMEIIDNPFDYRRGRKLNVHVYVDKKTSAVGHISVLDTGGEGMDAEGLQDWIQWGTGHIHTADHIGQYHVGGKLASIYLGESLEIICRRAGSSDIYRLYDPKWGSRITASVLPVEQLDMASAAWKDSRLSDIPSDSGFTLVTLEGLANRRYERTLLLERLSSTYRELISTGACVITLDGEIVKPLVIPESATHANKTVVIPKTKLGSDIFARGSIWIMDRDRIPNGRGVSIKAGIRTLFNGRLITQGEEFGHNLGGKGSLQRLMGEIHIDGLKPTADKSKWLTSDPNWEVLSMFMREKMQPLVAFLNKFSESTIVSRAQRKRTEAVRRELAEAFKRLERGAGNPLGQLGETTNAGGRKPPESQNGALPTKNRKGSEQREVRNRTGPPPNSVGILLRKMGGDIPKIDYEPLGQGERSLWGEQGVRMVINTDYPLYDENSDKYLVETICLHLLKEDESFRNATVAETLAQVDRIVWAWQEVSLWERSS